MLKASPLFAATIAFLLGGCTVVDVVTLPVRAAKVGVDAVGAGVDAVTTSQSEADEKRGREIRKREERLGELARDYHELADDCARGDDRACRKAVQVRAEMDRLAPTIPQER